jgi:hypothetical protein
LGFPERADVMNDQEKRGGRAASIEVSSAIKWQIRGPVWELDFCTFPILPLESGRLIFMTAARKLDRALATTCYVWVKEIG